MELCSTEEKLYRLSTLPSGTCLARMPRAASFPVVSGSGGNLIPGDQAFPQTWPTHWWPHSPTPSHGWATHILLVRSSRGAHSLSNLSILAVNLSTVTDSEFRTFTSATVIWPAGLPPPWALATTRPSFCSLPSLMLHSSPRTAWLAACTSQWKKPEGVSAVAGAD